MKLDNAILVRLLILLLTAVGGFVAGQYPAEFAAFCSKVRL